MGSSKAAIQPPQPRVWDDRDRDDAASMSSAVLLGDIDAIIDDGDLPSYSESQPYTDEVPSVTSDAPVVPPYVPAGRGQEAYNPYVFQYLRNDVQLTHSSQDPTPAPLLIPQCWPYGDPHPIPRLQHELVHSLQHAPAASFISASLFRPVGWNAYRDCPAK